MHDEPLLNGNTFVRDKCATCPFILQEFPLTIKIVIITVIKFRSYVIKVKDNF